MGDGNQILGTNFYCLNAKAGNSWTAANPVGEDPVNYNKWYDLEERSTIIEQNTNNLYKNVAESEYYKQVMWILANLYSPDENATEQQKLANKRAFLEKAGIKYVCNEDSGEYVYIYEPVNGYDYTNFIGNGETFSYQDINHNIINAELSDELIQAVQQAAIWYFTNYQDENNNPGKTDTTYNAYLNHDSNNIVNWLITSDGTTNTSKDTWPLLNDTNTVSTSFDDDINVGTMLQKQATILYDYLVDAANNYANEHQGDEYEETTPLKITIPASGNANCSLKTVSNTDYYVVGPIKIGEISNAKYTLNNTISVNNSTETGAYISDANGNPVNKTVEESVGTEFYISIPKTAISGNNITIKFTGSYNKNKKILWISNTEDVQPIVEIIPITEPIELQVNAEIEEQKEFDLALRKAITKITNSAGTTKQIINEVPQGASRLKTGKSEIDYNTNTIATSGTATYLHRKDPVVVEKGDIITYSISIYNEGDEDGYASTIIDKLPEGLEIKGYPADNTHTTGNFVKSIIPPGETTPIEISYSYVYDPASNVITITNNSKRELKSYEKMKNIDGTLLDHDTIEIECEVVQEPSSTTKTYLTNIAYISKEHNSEKNQDITNQEGLDRDSVPSNYPNATQVTTGNEYTGYHGGDNHNGNSDKNVYNDGTDNNDYFKGKEDDDDFEIIVIKPKQFDLALKKYISSITSNGTTKAGRQAPVPNTRNLANGTKTTADYDLDKTPLKVKSGDFVTYTLRVYNEGDIAGLVDEITDNIPIGLQFVYKKENAENTITAVDYNGDSSDMEVDSNTFSMIEEINGFWSIDRKENNQFKTDTYNGDTTISVTCDVEAYRDYQNDKLDIQLPLGRKSNYLDAYDKTRDVNDNGAGLDYLDVQIVLRVSEPNSSKRTIRNEAAITKAEDTAGNVQDVTDLRDRDSETKPNDEKPGNPWHGKESDGTYQDDEDFDNIVLEHVDLALTKFIIAVSEDISTIESDGNYLTKDKTKVNAGSESNPYDRQTQVDTTPLIDASSTDAIYTMVKTPLEVPKEAYVLYNIRVYNEGDVDVYAGEVTDYLPEYLDFISCSINDRYGWSRAENERTIKTSYLSKSNENGNDKILKAFDRENDNGKGSGLDYKDLPILCKLKEKTPSNTNLINSAEISIYEDKNGDEFTPDVDSSSNNLPDDMKTKEGKPEGRYSTDNRTDDDEDYDVVYIKPNVDLALTKFIIAVSEDENIEDNEYLTEKGTKVNAGTSSNKYIRQTSVDTSPLIDESSTDAIYHQVKTPLEVPKNAYVLYNIRVYNEGEVDVYAGEVTDYLPDYLEFISGKIDDIDYGWIQDENNPQLVRTDYLSSKNGIDKMLKAFDKEKDTEGDGSGLDYKDLPILCRLKNNTPSGTKQINSAAVTKYEDKDGHEIPNDVDSDSDDLTEEQKNKEHRNQDDDDYEVVLVKQKIDLALTKFIIAVSKDASIDEGEYLTKDKTSKNAGSETNPFIRQTLVDTSKLKNDPTCHDATYTMVKDPLTVAAGDYVLYNIRVYNEGEVDAYAAEVTDYLPEYLDFVSGSFNDYYKWKITSDGKTVKTTFLSSENGESNKLKAFDKEKDDEHGLGLDYRDLPILCRVNEKALTNKKMINSAAITVYEDKEGNEIPNDEDSSAEDLEDDQKNKENRNEDDDDYEVIIVKTFDLSLIKFVSTVYVTEDGKTKTTQTGNVGDSNDIIPKVEINRKKLNSTVVKFGYTIKITNEGDIAGYAKEITDYVPEGLKFYSEDNTGWTDEGNNVISTRLLENTLLQPGESATVTVIFRWINGSTNLGLKTNTAEISEDYNEEGVPDRDSVPDNKKPEEDDIDTADVILSISTGLADNIIKYATYGSVILVVLGTGIFLIKKYVI